jgi:serine/threonine protein kinase
LIHIVNGIQELHGLGYIHRDIKPDNVVLNINPFEVRVIDFNATVLDTEVCKGIVRGTPGYFP